MALLSQILAGLKIGDAGTDIIVRYSKEQYQEKIDRLQGCLSRLEQHQSNLEGLKNRLKQIWDDDLAMKYQKTLDDEIKTVRNAHENTQNQIDMWQSAIREMEDTVGEQEEKLDLVSQALNALNIKD